MTVPAAREGALFGGSSPQSQPPIGKVSIGKKDDQLSNKTVVTSSFPSSFSTSVGSNRRVGITKPVFDIEGLSPSYLSLSSHINELSNSPACINKPVYTTLGKVQSLLYWQLIENFYGTMKRFGHSDCAVMICISDVRCMELCARQGFPCFDYRHPDPSAHTMEQVATVKLFHIGVALERGAHVFLLDLDVGFLRDPNLLVEGFLDNPLEHVRSQMDVGYSHHKETHEPYTHPRPNFGVFLVKSHIMAVMAFRRAWGNYLKSPKAKKALVATDQNSLAVAMKWARWRWDFNFSYFHLGLDLDTKPRPVVSSKVVLLDKIDAIANKGTHFELGGLEARREFSDTIGVHATCYEAATKLHVLKACNAYWDAAYYDPRRRTLTKPLMYISGPKLRDEVATLGKLCFPPLLTHIKHI